MQWRKLKALGVTFEDIMEAVSSSDKQRFGLLYAPADARSQTGLLDSISEFGTSDEKSQEESLRAAEEDASKDAATSEDATAQALAASVDDTDPSHYRIRARQGHSIRSIDASSLLKPLSTSDIESLPQTVVHGTYHAAWPKILETGGLKCMSRNQIHFATGPPLSSVLPNGVGGEVTVPSKLIPRGQAGDDRKGKKNDGGGDDRAAAVISGMRVDAQILIYIDLKKALAAGCPFWISENGVVLSEGMDVDGGKIVGTEFFDVVVELRNGLGVIWENGTLVQKTPDWMLKARAPQGKGERRNHGPNTARRGAARRPRVNVERELDYADQA